MEPIALMIHVTDVDAASSWYQKVFPASVVLLESHDLVILTINEFALEIVRADKKVSNGKSGSVLYWQVSDIDNSIERLLTLGAKLYRGPLKIDNESSMCQFEDPFGNLIGLRGKTMSMK